jgi:hypothetical protein
MLQRFVLSLVTHWKSRIIELALSTALALLLLFCRLRWFDLAVFEQVVGKRSAAKLADEMQW